MNLMSLTSDGLGGFSESFAPFAVNDLNMHVLGAPDCEAVLQTSPDGTNWTDRVTVKGGRWGSAASDVEDSYLQIVTKTLGSGAFISILVTGNLVTLDIPVGGAVPGYISCPKMANPYQWTMGWIAYNQPELITGTKLFGHADNSDVATDTVTITGNDGGVLDAGSHHLIVLASANTTAASASDDKGSNWYSTLQGGGAGPNVFVLGSNENDYTASDVITLTLDQKTPSIAYVFQVTGTGGNIGSSGGMGSNYTDTAQVQTPGNGIGPPGDGSLYLVSIVATAVAMPADPNGYTNITRQKATGQSPLFSTASLGRF